MKEILFAGMGGFIGTLLRASMSHFIPIPSKFIITFLINIIGSFLLGLFSGMTLSYQSNSNQTFWIPFLTVGICGGFTTFSTFSLENMKLIQEGKWMIAATYMLGSLIFGLTAVYLGQKITH